MINERYLTISDVAEILTLSKSTVYKKHKTWAADGLKVLDIDGATRFPASSFHAWANKKRVAF